MAARKQHRPREKWAPKDRTAAFRLFVETNSISEASRQSGVPLGTLAGWLDDPAHAPEVESLRRVYARAIAEEDHRLAREAAAGLREGVAVCRAKLAARRTVTGRDGADRVVLECDGKDAAALTRALLSVRLGLDRMGRLDRGEPTENLGFVAAEAEDLDEELRTLLRDPKVRARMRLADRGGS